MLAWLSVWSKVQMIWIWFSWCHPTISISVKYKLVLAYQGCPMVNCCCWWWWWWWCCYGIVHNGSNVQIKRGNLPPSFLYVYNNEICHWFLNFTCQLDLEWHRYLDSYLNYFNIHSKNGRCQLNLSHRMCSLVKFSYDCLSQYTEVVIFTPPQ